MKPGDKVICINDNNLYHIPVRCICKGIIYTIMEVFKCKCGNVYVRLEEVNKYYRMWCPGCDVYSNTIMFFHIERFRLLDQEENTGDETERKSEPQKVHSINPN